MHSRSRSGVSRAGAIVVCSLAGSTLLAIAVQPILHEKAQLLPFTLAVLAAAYFGGLIPGLITTALSYALGDYFFIEPRFEILTDYPSDFALLGMFLAYGISTSLLANAVLKAMGALREANERMDIASSAAHIGFHEWIIADDKLVWTPQSVEMLGIERDTRISSYEKWKSTILEEDRERVDSVLQESLQLRRPDFSYEYRVRAGDGSIHHIESRSRLVLSESGTPKRLITANIDITDRKHTEEIVIERSRELARSNEELQRFAYTIAHDLQEPLRGIRLSSELLLKRSGERLDAASMQLINSILGGADRMKRLIRAILEFASVSYEPAAAVIQVDLQAIANAALQHLRTAIDEAGAHITLGPLPVVYANEAQMLSLFQNYIGNAIKYHGEKTPEIEVSSFFDEDGCVISIKDNGTGIDPKYHDRIFETFSRLHDRARYQGTGIGLATCKRIVERHGGRTWVESEPGKGATFYFTIPGKSLVHLFAVPATAAHSHVAEGS